MLACPWARVNAIAPEGRRAYLFFALTSDSV